MLSDEVTIQSIELALSQLCWNILEIQAICNGNCKKKKLNQIIDNKMLFRKFKQFVIVIVKKKPNQIIDNKILWIKWIKIDFKWTSTSKDNEELTVWRRRGRDE